MRYELWIERAAERELQDLEPELRGRVIERIRGLADDPRGPNTKALAGGLRGLRRLRIGDWRVCYQIEEEAAAVTIIEIDHRQDIYRRLLRRRRG
ncbi:MAG: type II toxin-antitoxin system RelE/ParE family toxin [Armatimonadota bacterium]|nr:type II toxin-antitoxin system RelE/ParE family toxin [Armatimonadota bacterium]